jgi:hypothetical protein
LAPTFNKTTGATAGSRAVAAKSALLRYYFLAVIFITSNVTKGIRDRRSANKARRVSDREAIRYRIGIATPIENGKARRNMNGQIRMKSKD